jgi:hypothetical protein
MTGIEHPQRPGPAGQISSPGIPVLVVTRADGGDPEAGSVAITVLHGQRVTVPLVCSTLDVAGL